MADSPMHPHCFATVFYNDTTGGTTPRRRFQLDIAMARLWVSRMLSLTSLPIFILHNRGNAVSDVLAPWLNSDQVVLRKVRPVVVEPPGTHSWYRMTHTKFQAWSLHRDCGQVALIDYDVRCWSLDDQTLDDCANPSAHIPTSTSHFECRVSHSSAWILSSSTHVAHRHCAE